jgi:hypothetical protein
MTAQKFVLSASHFESVKDAEEKVNNWFRDGGQPVNKKVKLYQVTETYDLRLKFIKRKEKK